MSKTAFAIAAHPDDIEFVMAGTMIHLAAAGYELHYMNVANGCCGTQAHDRETIIHIRREEARRAAEHLGATFHDSLTNDLEIFYDKPTLLRLASIVREVAPQIILTHSPQDYMEDHMNTARLAVTAAFSRGMPNFPVEPPAAITDQPVTIYHAQPHGNCDGLRQPISPEMFVDITDVLDRKTEMLALHESQKLWLDRSQGMDSYLHTMHELCREVGRLSGRFEYAEGWRRHSHLGLCGAADDPLRTALAGKIAEPGLSWQEKGAHQ